MSSKLKLYYFAPSPAVRSTLLTVAALGLDVELITVDLAKDEQMKPDFLEKNPLHTVPTLEHGDVVIADSHAINAYLVGKFGENDSLYPKDLHKRALVDQRLYWEAGVLFPRLGAVTVPLLEGASRKIDKASADKLLLTYQSLESILERSLYVSGKNLTIADFSVAATFSSANALVPAASNRFPTVHEWFARIQSLPYYSEANQKGLDAHVAIIKSFLSRHRRRTTMSKPKLFYSPVSPAVRSTLLTIAALDLDVDLVPVNLMAGEHLKPEYLKKNPLHTVPTLEDGDFTIFDSHAINSYLVGKYGKNDSLYPQDLRKRAVVDQRLHWDSGVLFPRMGAIVGALLRGGAKTIEKDKADLVVQAYQSLEALLDGHSYVAGDHLTIADFSLVATLSSSNAAIVPVASNTFPKISQWLSRMQALPYYAQANQVGLDMFKGMIQSKLA
ncbi:uncharacterized protein LOC132698663 [Cylas formicarius]|uniref:uncharacterized protein LOC132698663 n=1 Tax=Cylas formicarius TaxID=197179 RepID=UPI002958B619|nr:uncharacterized protein LOC132698663 [Cylas formicarius]